jgi:hypothetical protein
VSAWRASLDAMSPQRLALAAALVTLVVGLTTMTSDLIGVFFDDAIYVLVAKGIAEGQGYVYPQLPGTPPAIHYPPVWPALLALVWKFGPAFPDNLGLLKAINPLVMAVAAYAGTLVGARLFAIPVWVAALAVLAATTSVPMHVLTNVVLSEPLFIALLFPTMYVAERLRADGGWRWALAAGALAGTLVLTRTIAGAFVGATGLVLMLERRWRDVSVYTAVVIVMLAPWQYFVWKHSPGFPDELRGSYGPYLEWVADGYRAGGLPFLGEVLNKNIADTWRSLGAVLTPRLAETPLRPLGTVLALLFTALGLIASFRRPSGRMLAIGTVAYSLVVLAWPFQVDRFLWAMWPVLLLFALDGVRFSVRALRAHGKQPLALTVTAIGALLVLGHTVYNARGLSRGWANAASTEMSGRFEHVVRYVNADARLKGKVIATEAAPMVALYTGLQAVPVEMLIVRDHVEKKTTEQSARIMEAIDLRFRPDAYVLLPRGPHLLALINAKLDSTRRFVELTTPNAPVRSFLSVTQ